MKYQKKDTQELLMKSNMMNPRHFIYLRYLKSK